MKRLKAVTRARRGTLTGPVAAALMLIVLARASTVGAQVSVAVGHAVGAPGSSAAVTSSLTGGGGKVATVGFDVLFDVNILNIQTSDCVIAPRLSTTHVLETFLPQPGRLRLGVFDLVPPLNTFEDGDLATCTFQINASAPLGVTQLTMQNLEVSDNSVPPVVLPSTAMNGDVAVSLVNQTPTPTPVPPTSTPLPTNTPTNTVLPNTATPTRTNTPGAAPTNTAFIPRGLGGGGGCAIAAANSADLNPLAWLVVPTAVLLWGRRARR